MVGTAYPMVGRAIVSGFLRVVPKEPHPKAIDGRWCPGLGRIFVRIQGTITSP